MPAIDRRQFLQNSAALAASLSAFEAASTRARAEETPADPKAKDAKKVGPNDQIRVAVIGVNGAGGWSTSAPTSSSKDVRITTICDVDKNVDRPGDQGDRARSTAPSRSTSRTSAGSSTTRRSTPSRSPRPTTGTPWRRSGPARRARTSTSRSRSATTSAKAGGWSRPPGSTTGSSRPGTQCRSHKGIQDAIEFLRSGKLGKVYMAKGLCYKPRGSIGHKPDGPVPDGLDYNLWLGPAESGRSTRTGSTTTGTGSGTTATATSATRASTRWTSPAGAWARTSSPRPCMASGGRFGYKDDGETPNTQLVAFEFDDCELQFEVRGLPTNDELKVKIGDIFYGTEGVLAITSYTDWQTFLGPKLEKGPGGKGGGDHFANFLEAVEARDAKIAERRHRGGPPLQRLLPPRQHRLPARPQAPHQPLDRVVRQRRRGRRHADPQVSQGVRGAGEV